MKNISVFCGAHEGKNPRYAEDAKKIGEILAAKGINVVFGGGNVGLMKICLLYTSPSPRDAHESRMPSSA